MKTIKYILTLALTLFCALGTAYAIDQTYYTSIDGKSGSTLRDALYTLTAKGPTGMSYDGLWTAYKTTDVYPSDSTGKAGKIWDMYSNVLFTAGTNQCGTYSNVGDCYNREHSLPKSWFNEAKPAYYDLGHIVPTDGKVNGQRSNYPFGECASGTRLTNGTKKGLGKLGTSTFTGYTNIGKVFEPDDIYKGDFARMYMYMAVRYKKGNSNNVNLAADSDGQKMFNSTDANFGFTDYSVALLMKWHRNDPVSQKEIDRNNGMQTVQGNRNPFIDYPCLAEYLWGNKAGETISLSSLVGTFTGSWTTGDGCPCGNTPAITLPIGDIDCGATSANTSVTKTITVQGVNLTANLSLAVSGTNSSFFTISATSLLKASAISGTTITITYRPTAAGNHSATLTISGGGLASSQTFALSGTCCNPYVVTLSRNGITETVGACGTLTLPTAEDEDDPCDGWEFQGWLDSSTSFTEGQTTAPTSYVTQVSSSKTLHAVYAKGTTSAGGGTTTKTYGFEDADDATVWDIDNAITKSADAKASGTYGGIINTANTYITFKNKVNVTNFSFKLKRTSKNSNYNVYIETSSDNSTWTAAETYAMSDFGNGSYTSKSKDFDGKTALYVRFHCYNTTAVRHVDDISITYNGGGSSITTYKKSPCTVHTISYAHTDGVTTGGTYWADVTSALPGATITLDYDPSEGYALSSWSVTKTGGGSVDVSNNQFTMPDENVTVSATFNTVPKYDIKFYNNGNQIGSTQSVYKGSTPNVPFVEGCDGYTFVGWWTSALAADNTESKSWIEDFTATANKDYYAVFEHSSGGGSTNITLDATKDTSFPKDGITLTTSSGVLNNGTDYRIYKGATLTITSSVGNMTAIALTFDGSYNGGGWATSYTPNSSTWTSPACTSGNNGKQARITKIVVTVGSGSTTYYTSTTTCAAACTTLDAPSVTATPGKGQITLSWPDVTGADHYTVTIGKGAGYTTECGSAASIGTISHSGTTNTCVITGLTNGLAYTTTVVANASSSTCDSEADSDTTTPQECTQWSDPTLSWNKYSLNTTTANTATVTLSGTTHGTLSFESSNTDVLTVDGSTGTVTAVGAGEATVTAHWTAAGGYCEKTMTSQAFEVAGPLTISFDANGGTGTMSDQTVTYKQAAVIQDNTFTRDGYTFIGWATSADGDKVYNDKQSVTFLNSQTLYAVWMLNSHKVTFTPAPTSATVKVNNSSTSPVNNVNYGSTVTIAITPAEHYTVSALTVSGASGSVAVSGTGDTRTFTMPDEDVTVALTMEAESQYTATFHNGTATFATVIGYVDDDINAPTGTPTSCDDETFTFVGWVAAEQTTETTTMPEVVSFPQNMLSGGVDYYALFRRTEGGGGGEASVTFKTASQDSGSECTTDNDIKTNIVNTYTGIASFEGSKAYLGKSGVKLGTSSYSGSIALNLSSPITTNQITVEAVKYGTDAGNLKIEVNGSTAFGSELSPADGTLNFTDNEVEISSLTILTTAKRAYVASISLGGGGTSYYTTAPECAVCESQVTITKGAETNGTFTLSKANGTYDNCKKNVSVIVSNITPADGYYCTGVTATGNPLHMAVSGPDGSGNYTVAYAKNYSFTSTITANFEEIPTYTVTWSALGGEEISSATYREGATIAFPADPTGCEGKVFVGWTTEPIILTDDAPSFVTSATMDTSDITYYAVFATATTSGGGSASLIKQGSDATFSGGDNIVIVAKGTTYALYQETTNTSYVKNWSFSDNIETVNADSKNYLTLTAKDDAWYLGDDTNGYLYTSGSNNLAISDSKTEWTIEWNNTKSAFTIVGNSRYLSCRTDLSGSNQYLYRLGGTGTSTGIAFFDIYKVTTASGTTTYSGYTTLCYNAYERTFTAEGAFGTLCLPYSVNVSYLENAKAYSVTGKYVTGTAITGILLEEETTELVAGKSYVIQQYNSETEPTDMTMYAWYSPRKTTVKDTIHTQGMVGNLSATSIPVPAGCYGLSNNQLRRVGEKATATVGQYKAYFRLNDVPVADASVTPPGSKVMHTTDDAPTAIEQTNGQPSIDWNQPVYNILGIRVGKDATGVLIQNGIKYLR